MGFTMGNKSTVYDSNDLRKSHLVVHTESHVVESYWILRYVADCWAVTKYCPVLNDYDAIFVNFRVPIFSFKNKIDV